ncbi:MAG: C40 family peptidase [Lachnospiraceae bacterium]|nr:C40 family peptidase [Lachnospiraceae bacterium]
MKLGIITAKQAYLYEHLPNENFGGDKTDISDEVLTGWAVGILDEEGDFSKILTHYGYEGWMSVKALKEVSKETLEKRDAGNDTYVVYGGYTDVMSIPTVRGVIMQTLCRGSFVTRLEETSVDGYYKVMTAIGVTGYVPVIALQPRQDHDGFLLQEKKLSKNYFAKHCKLPKKITEQDTIRNQIVRTAKLYLGTQYRWGGKTPGGIDCSGLTFMSYMLNGFLIYRDASIEEGYPVKPITREEMKPADLLYFPGHVAMYIGDDRYIHSTGNEKSFGCVINSLNPKHSDYREDLPGKIKGIGSIFA